MMATRRVMLAVGALACVSAAMAAQTPKSGLAPGSAARPFDVYHVSGPKSGQTMCYT